MVRRQQNDLQYEQMRIKTPPGDQLFLDFEHPEELPQLLTVDEIYERCNERLLIQLEEDLRIERKPATIAGPELGKYFSMWANTSPFGGILVAGQRDKKAGGGFYGASSLNDVQLNNLEKWHATYCPDARVTPKRVEVTNLEGKRDFVVVFRVQYDREMVVKTNTREAYIRRGDSKYKLTQEEIQQLASDKGEVNYEEQLCSLEYPRDFKLEAISQWAKNVRLFLQSGFALRDDEILANRHLGRIENGTFRPNIACALLFANDPRSIIPGCRVRVMRFDGTTEGTGERFNAVWQNFVEGTVPELINGAAERLETQLKTFSPFHDEGGKFYPVPEYPPAAWYEALVNACMHRSYGNGMKALDIKVKVFDDRLEIESPGPFPPFVTPETIYTQSAPRNPRLFEAAFFLNLVQMNREGTRRMRDLMAGANLPEPEFSQNEIGHSLVRVRFRNNIDRRRVWVTQDISRLVSSAFVSQLSESEIRVLNWIADYGKCSVSDVVRILDVEWGTAKRLLVKLAASGVLQYVRFEKVGDRDSRAFFRLPSEEPLPEGAWDASPKPREKKPPKKARGKKPGKGPRPS